MVVESYTRNTGDADDGVDLPQELVQQTYIQLNDKLNC
jgi:hypothetical protein